MTVGTDPALSLSRVHFPVTTLGPGRRLGIWFQGCSIRCPGCISSDTWASRPPGLTLPGLLARISGWLETADGVTISGGEPFDQPEALESLLRSVRKRTDADILVFSGYEMPILADLLGRMPDLIDALVSGRYRPELGRGKALRGSANQDLHLLTPLGQGRFGPLLEQPAEDRLDLLIEDDGSVFFAGIPAPGDFHRLRRSLEATGHVFRTTEDTRR